MGYYSHYYNLLQFFLIHGIYIIKFYAFFLFIYILSLLLKTKENKTFLLIYLNFLKKLINNKTKTQWFNAADIFKGGCPAPTICWNKEDDSTAKSFLPDSPWPWMICPLRGWYPIIVESIRYFLPAPTLFLVVLWEGSQTCYLFPAFPEAEELGSANDTMQRLP